MSGIAGIFQPDGAPVDAPLLERMTACLAFRGPDARETWIQGNVGFGHALLRTTREAERERQPCTLDGRTWITADVRVDRRDELMGELEAAGRRVAREVTDPELILHAWHAWHERCCEHLLGDFAFALWDAEARRLFCARDHFGVKLFYYSRAGGGLLFSNTLQCLRRSGAVSGELNDGAVVDFLLHGYNLNLATTTFRDIQRLPPGHFLVCSETEFRIGEYWRLPMDEPVFYRRADDYVERFRELQRTVVRDRLRTNRVGVFMSGGLDSSGLAAAAREILAEQPSYDLRAYTVVYERLIPDNERQYAGVVAKALGIPIHFLPGDGFKPYERWEQLHTPEPVHSPTRLAQAFEQFTLISSHSRVMFYGEGPDNAMYYEWKPYVLHMLRGLHWGWLFRDFYWHARFQRAVPMWKGLPNRLTRLRQRKFVKPQPDWIRPEMLRLATRWEEGQLHPFRPIAHAGLTGGQWQSLFAYFDGGTTTFPVEVRHPYMDVRMIRYLLTVPPIPWCRSKYLTRRAWQERLPEAVLRRPKTPMPGDALAAAVKAAGMPQWVPDPALSRYVDVKAVSTLLMQGQPDLWELLKPVSLNFWLASGA